MTTMSTHLIKSAGKAQLLERKRGDFADRNVESSKLHESAIGVLPGGNTRSLFYQAPFPLSFVSGHDSVLVDADGHEYVDLLGDYTAGLAGHSDPRAKTAAFAALDVNMSVGGIHPLEQKLAKLMCARWNLDLVRFTNSGSEANLMAITGARMYTNKPAVMTMHGGYHGGLMYFGNGAAAWNAPYPTVVGQFNDLSASVALLREHKDNLAALLIEPMMGSAGCIPATPEFLQGLTAAARECGVVVILDEVMTSRLGPRGLAAELGVSGDMSTFGKYIAGGFSFGAFGGSKDFMSRFDATNKNYIPHAGTFNNNVTSMAAGIEVLTNVYPADIAGPFTARGDDLRENIAGVFASTKVPFSVTGFGTMMSLHARAEAPIDGPTAADRDPVLQELLFLGLLDRGFYVAPRGSLNLSLPVTDDQLAQFLGALTDVCDELKKLS
jgi:glutamate-1-semialdehyde 2,1-aminomutase